MARIAGYVRCSSQEAADRGAADTQIIQLQQWAKQHDHDLVEVFVDEGVSGVTPFDKRPESSRLCRCAARGEFELVVSTKVDRIGRSIPTIYAALETLEKLGIGYISVTEPALDATTPYGRMTLGLMSTWAGLERDLTRERSYSGRRRVAALGKPAGGPPALGLCRNAEGYLTPAEEIVPGTAWSEAAIIRRMFQMLVEQQASLYRVEQVFNEERVPTYKQCRGLAKGADRWTHATLQTIVKNPVYKGVLIYGKKRSEEAIVTECVALVSPTIWGAAQLQLATNRKHSPRNARQVYLLSGLCSCTLCGHSYQGFCHRRRWRYYGCSGRISPMQTLGPSQSACVAPYIRADDLEAMIWGDIVSFSQRPDEALAAFAADLNDRHDELPGLQEQVDRFTSLIKALEDHRQRALRLFLKGQVSELEKDTLLAEIDSEGATFETGRREKQALIDAILDQRRQLRTAESLLAQMQRHIGNATPEQKQKLIRQAVRKIVIYPDHIQATYCFTPSPVISEDINISIDSSEQFVGIRVTHPL